MSSGPNPYQPSPSRTDAPAASRRKPDDHQVIIKICVFSLLAMSLVISFSVTAMWYVLPFLGLE